MTDSVDETSDYSQRLRIATRASQLALWQANYVADSLREQYPDLEVELVHVTTTGDQDQTEPLRSFGGLGVFTREVQKAVLDGRADLAVHSLKDLPTQSVAGLTLAAVPERASHFDALVLPEYRTTEESEVEEPTDALSSLTEGAVIGTGSVRRQAQLLHHRPDLQPKEIRGNVETRLRKLDEGEYDAIILAEAGLNRLGFSERISHRLQPPVMFPAVSQGALGLECRADDDRTSTLLRTLIHEETFQAVLAERTLLAELRAGCHAPLGVLTSTTDNELTLEAVVLSVDGTTNITAAATAADPVQTGLEVAELLRTQGADELLGTE